MSKIIGFSLSLTAPGLPIISGSKTPFTVGFWIGTTGSNGAHITPVLNFLYTDIDVVSRESKTRLKIGKIFNILRDPTRQPQIMWFFTPKTHASWPAALESSKSYFVCSSPSYYTCKSSLSYLLSSFYVTLVLKWIF